MNRYQPVPWSNQLKITTYVMTAALLVGGLAVAFTLPDGNPLWARLLVAGIPVTYLLFNRLGMIQAYVITEDQLIIERPLFSIPLSLSKLEAAEWQPDVMQGARRAAGNGILFSISGLFNGRDVQQFRAYVTDRHPTVLLRFTFATVVVSPQRPQEFIDQLQGYLN